MAQCVQQLPTMKTVLACAALLSFSIVGCNTTVTNGECAEEDMPPQPGCGDSAYECVDGEWVEIGSNRCSEPEPFCPMELPESGSECFGDIECEYPGTDEECGDPNQPIYATCLESEWVIAYNKCSEPPPECPSAEPQVGADCSEYADLGDEICTYEYDCGPGSNAEYTCDLSTDPPSWQVVSVPNCGPIECEGLDAESCGATSECQWLTPGCDENAIAEGCYSVTDCQTTDGCNEGEACVVYSYNPCENQPCDACGAQFGVCEEAPQP